MKKLAVTDDYNLPTAMILTVTLAISCIFSQCGVADVVRPASSGGGDEPTVEFRGVFMATVANIDWPRSEHESSVTQLSDLRQYVDIFASTHINAIMFQARTAGDALYNSTIEPWSAYLTGTQGKAPSPYFDPLTELISAAHRRGIEVHAWLNPYIANRRPDWGGLAPNHMAIKYRQYAYPYDRWLWMDPGAAVVADRIVDVVNDIITRYEVDGIHFDDYFYPYPDSHGTPFPDNGTYQAYLDKNGTLSLAGWRRNNINRMVERVYNTVKSLRPYTKFSISPFGLYRPGEASGMPPPISGFDPYSQLYADSALWLRRGWVDFLAPQLYWSVNSTGQSYPLLLDWWLQHNPLKRNIYAALAVYRIAPPSSWPLSELESQIKISRDPARRDLGRSLGNILFSAKFFRDNTRGLRDDFRSRVYTGNATVPETGSERRRRLRVADISSQNNNILL